MKAPSPSISPTATRAGRIQALKTAADVAAECNIAAIHTHCGFIPENPNDPTYKEVVSAIHDVASHCKQRNRMMLCETGQETPITLLRMIEDVGLDNVAVNLDMANLILYGKGNPVDAMDVIGSRVRGLHAKDGLFPVDPMNLGKEVPIGQGKVDFRGVVQRLHDFHYQGAITIEREIEGDEQTRISLRQKPIWKKSSPRYMAGPMDEQTTAQVQNTPITAASTPKLVRVLGLGDLILYGIVLIMPIAAVPLFGVAQQLSNGHAVTTILLAMVAMMLTAYSYGRMAACYPSAGSAYVYAGRGLNPHLGFLAGWAMLLDYLLVPLICTIYGALTIQRLIPSVPYSVWAAIFAGLMTLINLRGIRATVNAT